MSVSLYACGTATIEVGKYGMSLEHAKEAFLKTCKELGVELKKIEEFKNVVKINLKSSQKLYDLLSAVADVDDLHGNPPSRYMLKDFRMVPDGEYVRTGSYND